MINKLVLVAGIVAYRDKRGQTEWFVIKTAESSGWELPKRDVRRGESSVRAAIRLMDDVGESARVLEEAGRATVSTTSDGESIDQKLIFYLMRRGTGGMVGITKVEGKWMPYASAKRGLSLVREQRILQQANSTLRAWQRQERIKSR
ncbi:MAG: hypothetical protein HY377_00825 [Candidatus Blackburnbacteria bacterium]|nr:hypothetical protein [Candidatus Blackburnbacteria bacterium]